MFATQCSAGFKQWWRRHSRAEYLGVLLVFALLFACYLKSKVRDYVVHFEKKKKKKLVVFSAHYFSITVDCIVHYKITDIKNFCGAGTV